jgi:hypothetical protein
MKRRYVLSRDEPGSTEEQILDYAETEEEARRKLLDWNEEYRHEVTSVFAKGIEIVRVCVRS